MIRDFDKQVTRDWFLGNEWIRGPMQDVLFVLLGHDLYHLWDRENVIKTIQAELREDLGAP